MARGFVDAIKRKPLSHDTDAMKPRWHYQGVNPGPHLRVCIHSARDVVEMERRSNSKEEDRQIIHFDDVGNDEVDSGHTDSSLP